MADFRVIVVNMLDSSGDFGVYREKVKYFSNETGFREIFLCFWDRMKKSLGT